MAYIEKKYKEKIAEIFENLKKLDTEVLEQLNKKSISCVDEIAKLCAQCNRNINQILKQYYPEIKELNDKLKIKSSLKFYFELIDKLTDYVKNVEQYHKIDEKYYETLIKFIEDKEDLISGKFSKISAQELTAFYDKVTRDYLEKTIAEKFEKREREYFSIGPLEQEIKKIGQIAGAKFVFILKPQQDHKTVLETVESVIDYSKGIQNIQIEKIGEAIKSFLESKKYKVVVYGGLVLTDAILLPDNN
ncbi:MAG: hypothetical protein ACFE8E_00505 [Candidatus Hodarchaeota archaeon]